MRRTRKPATSKVKAVPRAKVLRKPRVLDASVPLDHHQKTLENHSETLGKVCAKVDHHETKLEAHHAALKTIDERIHEERTNRNIAWKALDDHHQDLSKRVHKLEDGRERNVEGALKQVWNTSYGQSAVYLGAATALAAWGSAIYLFVRAIH